MTGIRRRKRIRGIGIGASALIVIAGLLAAAGIEVATRTLTPAALAAAGATVPGTDVSNLTTVTSWAQVKAAGMAFAGVLAVDGATVVNGSYGSQVTGALDEGLYVMPYVVADPLKTKVPTGTGQFTKAWAVISSTAGAPYAPGGQYLPIALDMEQQPAVTPKICYGLTRARMVTWIRQFITAARARTGMTPVIYSTPDWWRACTGNTTAFGADPLWVAAYDVTAPAIPRGWTGYTFWQSSDTATVNGIQGEADLDQMQAAPPVTAASGSTGSIQLQTLNSLAGQSVTYRPSAPLPAGVSLTPAGRLSWGKGAAIGAHTVTVTPSAPATPAPAPPVIPASISLTLRVHGRIAVSAPHRSSTAGTPILLQMTTSGPDQQAGFAPTLKAAGLPADLPAGLSMTPAGLITGWPARPGTFKVAVTASDGLGGAGRAAFTWTVRPAPDRGTAGVVRQAGGTGKCLNDPGFRTAHGTIVNLWSCTGRPNQRWTSAQDGTIRVLGKCLGIAGDSRSSGAKLRLITCDSRDGAQLWQAATDGQLRNPQSGKCLDVPAARAANGTQPVIEPCANSAGRPDEHWLRPAAPILSGRPGKCIAASGAAAVLAPCSEPGARHWQPHPDGTIRLGGKCLAEGGTTVRSVLSVIPCSGAAATRWQLLSAGPIAVRLASPASGLCVTVPPAGTRLIVAPCANDSAATWRVELPRPAGLSQATPASRIERCPGHDSPMIPRRHCAEPARGHDHEDLGFREGFGSYKCLNSS